MAHSIHIVGEMEMQTMQALRLPKNKLLLLLSPSACIDWQFKTNSFVGNGFLKESWNVPNFIAIPGSSPSNAFNQLSTPETHGETGSGHPKRSQKATLKC